MCRFVFHFFILLTAAAVLGLSPAAMPPVFAQNLNLFDKKPKLKTKKVIQAESVQRLRPISDDFNPETKPTLRSWVLYSALFGIIALLVGGLGYWQYQQRQHAERIIKDPAVLIQELNEAHRLSPPERNLMQILADENSLSSPLTLFVEPKYFLEAWENEFFTPNQPQIRTLASKLFGLEIGGNAADASDISAVPSSTDTAYYSASKIG